MAPSIVPSPVENNGTNDTNGNSASSKDGESRRPVQAGNKEIEQKSALEAISGGGVTLAPIPSFTDVEKQRHWQLEHMSGAFRVFSRKGYTEGMSGHISVRDPEVPDAFWTNPLGRHFGLLTPADMILVNGAGIAIGGNKQWPANAAGFQIHAAVHNARPDVVAACHTHSPYGKAWSAFRRPLEMLNQDTCLFYGDAQAVFAEFDGVVFSPAAGARLAAALGPHGKGLILANHGLLTVGHTVDEAAFLFTSLERSCEMQMLTEAARAAGKQPYIIDDAEAQFTFKMTSDPHSLYWEFQPDLEYEVAMSNGAFSNKREFH